MIFKEIYFFLFPKSCNNNWSKPINLGKHGFYFINYKQHYENIDTNDPGLRNFQI